MCIQACWAEGDLTCCICLHVCGYGAHNEVLGRLSESAFVQESCMVATWYKECFICVLILLFMYNMYYFS